jgi:hypothetical protein
MKKILSLLLGTVALATVSFAQNCKIDKSIISVGVYPAVSQRFVNGYVNASYEQVAQISVIIDTVIDLNGAPTAARFLYTIIDSVIEMPTGFSYAWNPSDCKIAGGDIGCIVMTGNPVLAVTNKKNDITTLYGLPIAWLNLGITTITFPVGFTDYSVIIQPNTNSSLEVSSVLTSNVCPNPASNKVTIEMNTFSSEEVKVCMRNTLGTTVASDQIKLNSGLNILSSSTSDINTGIYIWLV